MMKATSLKVGKLYIYHDPDRGRRAGEGIPVDHDRGITDSEDRELHRSTSSPIYICPDDMFAILSVDLSPDVHVDSNQHWSGSRF